MQSNQNIHWNENQNIYQIYNVSNSSSAVRKKSEKKSEKKEEKTLYADISNEEKMNNVLEQFSQISLNEKKKKERETPQQVTNIFSPSFKSEVDIVFDSLDLSSYLMNSNNNASHSSSIQEREQEQKRNSTVRNPPSQGKKRDYSNYSKKEDENSLQISVEEDSNKRRKI